MHTSHMHCEGCWFCISVRKNNRLISTHRLARWRYFITCITLGFRALFEENVLLLFPANCAQRVGVALARIQWILSCTPSVIRMLLFPVKQELHIERERDDLYMQSPEGINFRLKYCHGSSFLVSS